MSITRSLFSNKAHCFNQSGCALYGNFIINAPDIALHYFIYRYIGFDKTDQYSKPNAIVITNLLQHLEQMKCFK